MKKGAGFEAKRDGAPFGSASLERQVAGRARFGGEGPTQMHGSPRPDLVGAQTPVAGAVEKRVVVRVGATLAGVRPGGSLSDIDVIGPGGRAYERQDAESDYRTKSARQTRHLVLRSVMSRGMWTPIMACWTARRPLTIVDVARVSQSGVRRRQRVTSENTSREGRSF